MNLADIRKFTAQLAPRILIDGAEGVGKTTIASKFPAPIFLQTEDGCPSGLEINGFGQIDNFADLRSAIGALASEQHHYQTVVNDSLDATEELIWHDACRSQGWSSIESPGYGKGYVIVESWWIDILKGLEFLRNRLGMSVVLLAHSAIETINDPRAASYTFISTAPAQAGTRPGAGLVRRDRLSCAGPSRAERGGRIRKKPTGPTADRSAGCTSRHDQASSPRTVMTCRRRCRCRRISVTGACPYLPPLPSAAIDGKPKPETRRKETNHAYPIFQIFRSGNARRQLVGSASGRRICCADRRGQRPTAESR